MPAAAMGARAFSRVCLSVVFKVFSSVTTLDGHGGLGTSSVFANLFRLCFSASPSTRLIGFAAMICASTIPDGVAGFGAVHAPIRYSPSCSIYTAYIRTTSVDGTYTMSNVPASQLTTNCRNP